MNTKKTPTNGPARAMSDAELLRMQEADGRLRRYPQGNALNADALKRIGNWLRSDDTGISSETMAAITLGADSGDFDAPHDGSDFGRCYRLVEAVPEVRAAFPRIAALVPAFAGILAAWDELAAIYLRDLPTGLSQDLYDRIKSLRADKE